MNESNYCVSYPSKKCTACHLRKAMAFMAFKKGHRDKLTFAKMISTRALGLSLSLVILVGFTVFLCSQSLIKFLDYPTFMGSSFEDQRTGNFPDLTFCLHEGMNQVCTSSPKLIKKAEKQHSFIRVIDNLSEQNSQR